MESPTVVPTESTTPTVSALDAAVEQQNVHAVFEARAAARAGSPLPPVSKDAAPPASGQAAVVPAAAPGPPPLSAKDRKNQEADERLRTRVAEAVAERDTEIARLRAQIAAPPASPIAPPAAARPPETPIAEWKRLAALPDAPKLADFESVEEHTAAMALFIADTRYEERQAAASERSNAEQLTAAQTARVDGFVTQLEAAKVADPEFVAKLTPEVRELKPFGALKPGEAGGARNVIAEQLYDSPIAPRVLLHFSQHPEVLERLATMPDAILQMPAQTRVKAHIAWIVKEFGKLEGSLESTAAPAADPLPAARSTITAAPPPPPTLTRTRTIVDPTAAAVKTGNVGDFLAIRRAAREAKAQGRT